MNAFDLPAEELSYSNEAECSVIGAVLMQGADAYDAAALRAEDFFHPLHQMLWSELQKLVLAGKHVGVVELMESMRGMAVDWTYVHSLTEGHATMRAVQSHATVIRGHARSRALTSAARDVVAFAADESVTVEQRVSRSVSVLEAVVEEKSEKDVLPVGDFAVDFIDRLQALADGELQAAQPTHIPTLDSLLAGGLRDGQLIIIAARPSVGKSSFAQQIALSSASDGIPAAFFGMEMTSRELTNRTVANLGRVSLKGLKTGKMGGDDWTRVSEGVQAMRMLPLYLYDQPGMTLAEVVSKARMIVRKFGVKLLVVDYLQLMKGSGVRGERRVELEEITRGLKQLAKQLGIKIVLLSQLNREVEKRTNPRPQMSDLKECGAIEEDADVIMFLWTHRKGEEGEASIKGCVIGKNRDGETGELALHFEGSYQRWSESTESLHAPAKKASGGISKYTEEF